MRDKWEPYRIDIKYNLVDWPDEKRKEDTEEGINDIAL